MLFRSDTSSGTTATMPIRNTVRTIEEDWVRAANDEVDQRTQQRKYQPILKVLPDPAYEEEDFNDVEELDTEISNDTNNNTGSTLSALQIRSDGFASNYPRPSEKSILTAMENESELLNVRVNCHFSEDQDQTSIYAETTRRTITVRDNMTTTHSRNRRGSRSSRTLTDSAVLETTRRIDMNTVDHVGNDDSNSTAATNHPVLQKNCDPIKNHGKSKRNKNDDTVETDIVIPASCPLPSPIHHEQFYDCTAEISEDPTNTSLNMMLQAKTPNKDTFDHDTAAMDDMETAPNATPLNKENSNGDGLVDRDVLTTPPRRSTEPVSCRTSSENGVQDMDLTTTVLGIVAKALTPSKLSSQLISLATTNKKRQQSVALKEPPNVNDTPSKKKIKQIAAKTTTPTRLQDPTEVTHQIQLQGQHPPMILCQTSDAPNKEGKIPIRTVRVTKKLWSSLKPHQIEGIRFMWRNCFADLAYYDEGNTAHCGGCILAHNMGLVRIRCAIVCNGTFVGCILLILI